LARKEIQINQAKKNGYTPLLIACQWGRVDVMRVLLARKEIQINQASDDGTTPLYDACYTGRVDAVKLLLASKEIDINKESQGVTPLKVAQARGHTEIVSLLQQHNSSQ
jgi:ankyrin repeat protein